MADTLQACAWDETRAAEIIAAEGARAGGLLPLLQALHAAFGWLPPQVVPLVARALNLTRAEVHGVISFYHDFRQAPPPRRVVKLCGAEACQARGVARLAAELEARLTGRADVAIETVYCLGLCASGPAALIDGRPFGRLDADRLEQVLAEAEA